LFLSLPNMLHQGLLGILRSNTAEIGRSDFDFEFFTDLGIRLDPASIENGDLIVLGKDFFGNNQLSKSLDITIFRVNGATQLTSRADSFFSSRQERFLNSSHEDLAADAFLTFPKIQYS